MAAPHASMCDFERPHSFRAPRLFLADGCRQLGPCL